MKRNLLKTLAVACVTSVMLMGCGNTGSAEDIIKLNVWQEKAKSSNYYKNAIETWTIRDVQKYTIAKENNLNYLVFYSKKEIDNWLNK